MSRLYYVLHLILNIRHLDTGLHGETCHMYPVAQIIGLFHGCVRQCYCFRSLSLNIHVALGRAHTHHLIVNTVYPDILSTRVFSRVKQTFIHTFTYCADFTCFLNIHIVDEASIRHLLVLYMLIFGIQSLYATFIFLISMHCRSSPIGDRRSNDINFRHPIAQTLNIREFQIPPTSFPETFIRLSRLLRNQESRIRGKAFELGTHSLLHPLPATDKRHQHEDTPEYTECRQQASRLVSCNRDEDFLTRVYIYSHVNSD